MAVPRHVDLLEPVNLSEHLDKIELYLGQVCQVAGISGGLIFAVSDVMWSQAVITEVYTLNAFFLVILPVLGRVERTKPLPNSIAQAVLGEGTPIGAPAPPPAATA